MSTSARCSGDDLSENMESNLQEHALFFLTECWRSFFTAVLNFTVCFDNAIYLGTNDVL